MMISQEFKNALKLHPIPKFKLAWEAGISPSIFSHLLNGHQKVKTDDERILRVARLISFPTEKVFTKIK